MNKFTHIILLAGVLIAVPTICHAHKAAAAAAGITIPLKIQSSSKPVTDR